MRLRRVALSLLTAAAMTATTALVGTAPASAVTTREAAFLTKINHARTSHGLRPLRLASDLSSYARSHSRQMASSTALFHTPSFSAICCWSAIAENVGTGYSVRSVHGAFMTSSAHRANILNSRMRAVGVGVVYSGGRIWVTEIFRRPS